MTTDYNYGVLKYSSLNIGDEIQSIAAMRFLPRIDDYISRENTNKYKSKNGKKTKLIMNAWWMWEEKNFPPSKYIEPLMVSVHFRKESRDKLSSNKKVVKYLHDHSPIGCRDIDTSRWLTGLGIESYFSGCLTLTLQRNSKIKRDNYVLCVDVDDNIVQEIKKRTDRPVYNVSRVLSPYFTSIERLELAKLFLHLYHNAHCVVSPCLHAILPSAAFETPVLRLIEQDEKMHVNSRFEGMEDWFNTCTCEELLNNKNIYNFDSPPQNSNKHLDIRNSLIKKCTEFTGYCNDISPVDDKINPFIELIKLNKWDRNSNKNQKIVFFDSNTNIKQALKQKKRGINKHTYEDDLPLYSCSLIIKDTFSYVKYLVLSKIFLNKNNRINEKLRSKKEKIDRIKEYINEKR